MMIVSVALPHCWKDVIWFPGGLNLRGARQGPLCRVSRVEGRVGGWGRGEVGSSSGRETGRGRVGGGRRRRRREGVVKRWWWQ